jgi:hypothetical protein
MMEFSFRFGRNIQLLQCINLFVASLKLEQAIGKAFLNEDFAGKWRQNFDSQTRTILGIDDSENEEASEQLDNVLRYWAQNGKDIIPQNHDNRIRMGDEVQDFAFDLFKKSVASARKTFDRVSYMSYIIFGVGISLFTVSAITGLMQGKEAFSIAFGAFGVVSFVSFFIFSPSKNVQSALANLIQIEIIFMSFWNQIHFWARPGASSDPNEKAQASAKLQELTRDVVTMLEENIEGKKQTHHTNTGRS